MQHALSSFTQPLLDKPTRPNLNDKEKVKNHKNILDAGFMNIQHLYPKIDQIRMMINHGKRVFSIFALNETFLDDSYMDHEISIEGFSLVRRDRQKRAVGGIVVYVKNGIPFVRR